ncbi:Voltage-gated Ion Channel (VIC) Superfamily [Achlya hypogyna]|uniref:Voltage-gated Ion Channel (VIC) Superfamily n=1 Tax=Achlya hypogyna TaxID=1202772 RepID=A0A1V9ZF57_ACHHY|nr:Voltage-gated Ion Channel (VIC) Superfamily [Achlya hypogyna]
MSTTDAPRRSSGICTDGLMDRTMSGRQPPQLPKAAPVPVLVAPRPTLGKRITQRVLSTARMAAPRGIERTLTAAISAMSRRSYDPNVLRKSFEELENGAQYRYVLHPLSTAKALWDLLTVLLVVVYCWVAPLEMSCDWWAPSEAVANFMLFVDVWFILDMVLRFRTGYVDCGVIVMNPRAISKHYVGSVWFFVDAFSSFPLEFFLTSDTAASVSTRHSVKLVKYFKIPKLLRLGRLLKNIHRYRGYSGIVTVFGSLFFCAHCAACVWIVLVVPCPDGAADGLCANDQVMGVYLLAYHVALSALLGQTVEALQARNTVIDGGFRTGETPRALYLWAVLMQPLGAVFQALIFGNVIHLVQSVNRTGNAFRKKMDQVHHEMNSLNLPKELRQRVTAYYDYLWVNNRNLSEDMTLLQDRGMSLVLRHQIAIYLYKDQLLKIPFFQHATDDVLGMICMLLRQVVVMPGDYVFKEQGEIGKEMYMVVKGCIQVLPSELPDSTGGVRSTQAAVLLGDGDFFGEIGLIMEVYRTRSVRAASMAELCVLTKDGFNSILGDFPEFAIEMKKLVVERITLLYGQNSISPETLARITAIAERNLQKRIRAFGSTRRKIERQAELALRPRDRHSLQDQLQRPEGVPPSDPESDSSSADDDDIDDKLVANKVWAIAKQVKKLKTDAAQQTKALEAKMDAIASALAEMSRRLPGSDQPRPKGR